MPTELPDEHIQAGTPLPTWLNMLVVAAGIGVFSAPMLILVDMMLFLFCQITDLGYHRSQPYSNDVLLWLGM